jgi:hypothetical protein
MAHALVCLYPRAWRARYEAELLALVDDQGASPRIILDLAVGALRERASQLIDAYGSAVVDRSIFTPRVIGIRIAIVLVGNALSAILSSVLPPAGRSPAYLEGLYLAGWAALVLRTGWLGWTAHRDRRSPAWSRTFAQFEALGWMCAAVALGALSDRVVHFSLASAHAFATYPISSALIGGGGGFMLMFAFDAFVKQTASHRRWLAAQATR